MNNTNNTVVDRKRGQMLKYDSLLSMEIKQVRMEVQIDRTTDTESAAGMNESSVCWCWSMLTAAVGESAHWSLHFTVVARVCPSTGSSRVGMPKAVLRQHALQHFLPTENCK